MAYDYIQAIPIKSIEVAERQRPLSDAHVDEIYQDLSRGGLFPASRLLQPIGVVETKGRAYGVKPQYRLVYGAHRLAAFRRGAELARAKRNGELRRWQEIPARILGLNAEQAKMAEIIENLLRAPLSQAEQELHRVQYVALLKQTGEVAEGLSARGRRSSSGHDVPILPTASEKAAADLNVTPKTIARDFKAISSRAKAAAEAEGKPAPAPITTSSAPNEIEAAVAAARRADPIPKPRPAAKVATPVEADVITSRAAKADSPTLRALIDAWEAADEATRTTFLARVGVRE